MRPGSNSADLAYALRKDPGGTGQGHNTNYLVSFDSAFGRNSGVFDDETPPLKIGSGVGAPAGPAISNGSGVRRLTPTECCRLQGFPDDWLGEPNEPPDSPRYAALGDAVTVNVAQWIGERIMEAEAA